MSFTMFKTLNEKKTFIINSLKKYKQSKKIKPYTKLFPYLKSVKKLNYLNKSLDDFIN